MAELTVTLKLDRDTCIEHESVRFHISVTNTGAEPSEQLLALVPKNLAVRLVLQSGATERRAHQMSSRSRDGASFHEPDRPKTVSLPPGQPMTLEGDVLEYFGGIRAGKYQLSVVYRSDLDEFASEAVPLTVSPAKPVAAATPHRCQGMPSAPIAMGWVREGSGRALYYQESSGMMPPNLHHGYAVPGEFNGTHLQVGQLPYEDVPAAHLCWLNPAGALQVAFVDREKHTVSPGREIALPFAAVPLASPQSTQDGSVWVPCSDAKRERYAAVHVKPDGPPRVEELRVGSLAPIASYVNLWDYDANLFFAWAAEGKPEVRCAVLSLTEPDAHFKPLFANGFDSPIVWLDGYVDLTAGDDRDAILWCVRRKAAAFVCCKFKVATAAWITDAMLPAEGLPELTPFASIVGADRRLGVLFAGPEGELWYGSTKESRISRLVESGGKPITRGQSPGLLAASTDGVMPWIYLRYISAAGSLAMLKLEPSKEEDPALRWV